MVSLPSVFCSFLPKILSLINLFWRKGRRSIVPGTLLGDNRARLKELAREEDVPANAFFGGKWDAEKIMYKIRIFF